MHQHEIQILVLNDCKLSPGKIIPLVWISLCLRNTGFVLNIQPAHQFPLAHTRQPVCCSHCCCSLYLTLRSIKADVALLCPGGSHQRGHVHHHPRAPPLPADSTAAGAAGLRPARGLCWDAEEAGALPWHHREPPAHWLVLAELGGVHQWGEGAVPTVRLGQVQVALQPGWYHTEVSNHQGGQGKVISQEVISN